MLQITEYPHRGEPRTWTAESREGFVLRLLAAHPRAGLDPDISFDDAARWLREDLQDLQIEEA